MTCSPQLALSDHRLSLLLLRCLRLKPSSPAVLSLSRPLSCAPDRSEAFSSLMSPLPRSPSFHALPSPLSRWRLSLLCSKALRVMESKTWVRSKRVACARGWTTAEVWNESNLATLTCCLALCCDLCCDLCSCVCCCRPCLGDDDDHCARVFG